MYRQSYHIPQAMYRSSSNNNVTNTGGYYDERGFWIPFVVGGLAGGALGYGVANNNFLSNNNNGGYYQQPRPCCPTPIFYPTPYPYY